MEQRTDEWFKAREGKLTASRVAAALGLDPYLSRQKLWRQLTGMEEPRPATQRMQDGITAEPYALADYEVTTGNLAFPVGFVPHPEIAWIGASPDGLVGDDGLVEIKCPDPLHWVERKAVPPHHNAQIQTQLQCTGRAWCDYWVWNQNTGEHVLLRVERDPEFWAWAVPHLREFWQHVEMKTQPPRKHPVPPVKPEEPSDETNAETY